MVVVDGCWNRRKKTIRTTKKNRNRILKVRFSLIPIPIPYLSHSYNFLSYENPVVIRWWWW